MRRGQVVAGAVAVLVGAIACALALVFSTDQAPNLADYVVGLALMLVGGTAIAAGEDAP